MIQLLLVAVGFALAVGGLYLLVWWLQRDGRQSSGADEAAPVSAHLPYRRRGSLLTDAELLFLPALEQAALAWSGGSSRVEVQVPIRALIDVENGTSQRQAWRNKIDRKTVDFVVCDTTLTPRIVVELDDSTHAQRKRQERDDFVNRAFVAAGLPVVRVPTAVRYDAAAIHAELVRVTEAASSAVPKQDWD